MRTPLGAVVVATLTSLAIVAPTAAEEELYAGEYVDRESVPGVTHEILAATWLEYGDDHLMHVRTTLETGAGIPASVFSDYWASTVESGELTVVVRDRSGRLLDARMPTACESDWVWADTPTPRMSPSWLGVRISLEAGSWSGGCCSLADRMRSST